MLQRNKTFVTTSQKPQRSVTFVKKKRNNQLQRSKTFVKKKAYKSQKPQRSDILPLRSYTNKGAAPLELD